MDYTTQHNYNPRPPAMPLPPRGFLQRYISRRSRLQFGRTVHRSPLLAVARVVPVARLEVVQFV